MTLYTLFPTFSASLKNLFAKKPWESSVTHDISLEAQCRYAESMLRTLGLVKHFAPLIVFCGHDGKTHNDTYASMLACGACGGHAGGVNAAVLANICNQTSVRKVLREKGIMIPDTTHFLAATHSTTTDDMIFHTVNLPGVVQDIFCRLKRRLQSVRQHTCQKRSYKMGIALSPARSAQALSHRSQDWAEIKPEQGLVRCTALIIGSRWLTKALDLDGRAFLYSYDENEDSEGTLLSGILTGPAVVAHWINAQYLFSVLDPIAYGAGNKTTQNVTGNFSIMQGVASDLMYGLPLQSVYKNAQAPYHEPTRLLMVVQAEKDRIHRIVEEHPPLERLVKNSWIHLAHIGVDKKIAHLQPDLTWHPMTVSDLGQHT